MTEHDVVARRADVVRRLVDRGLSPRIIEALLPGWEAAIAAGVAPHPTGTPATVPTGR